MEPAPWWLPHPYDPRKALDSLESGTDTDGAWCELWNELYHQGDIGEASFAALPHLVRIHEQRGVSDWNTYAIAAVIELARDSADNPQVPADLLALYENAWVRLVDVGLRELRTATDETLVGSIMGVVAIGKGQRMLGALAIDYTEQERHELLEKAHLL